MSSDEAMELERSAPTPVLPDVRRSLAALQDDEQDFGARALALRYAELIDDARAADKYTKALRLVGEAVSSYADDLPITAGDQVRTAWDRISAALAEHSVASDLGPKLLAALTALNLTPAARTEKRRGPKTLEEKHLGQTAEVTPLPSALTLLRNEAARRRSSAG